MNKFLVMALAASMTLASCSKEDTGDKGKTGTGETTYAGVSITLPVEGTRAEDAAAGIAAEKAITTIGVYIVDEGKTPARLDYKLLTVATDFAKTTVSGRDVYTSTVAVPTVTGTKKVYVVANPTLAIQNKLDASGAYVMSATPTGFGLGQENFLTAASSTVLTNMVLSGAYVGTGGELDMTVAQDASTAIGAPISITIGRNLSKAVLQEGQNYTVTGGTTTLTWTLINRANDAYLIEQTAGTLFRTVPTGAETNNAHAYWTNFSGRTGTDYTSVLSYGGSDAKTAAYANSKYMLENYPAALHEGNTTGVRIKGVFVPTTIYNAITSGTPVAGAISSGTTFFRSTIDGSYWTAAGRTAAVSVAYAGHTSADFLEYTDGVGYYTIWVNDGAGSKGVKRNAYYLMQINEVKGPGSPTEPVDPLPPIDDDTNLSVAITVLNWDFYKSEQDIS